MEWNDKQCNELLRLQNFFYNVAKLNNSTNIIGNIQEVTKEADKFLGSIDEPDTLWMELYKDCISVRQARKSNRQE